MYYGYNIRSIIEMRDDVIQEAAEAVPLFWRVDLPDVLKVLSQRGVLPNNFLPVVKPHLDPLREDLLKLKSVLN